MSLTGLAAFSILAFTVSLSLARPKLWRIRIHHSTAATMGALLAISLGIVPPGLLLFVFHTLTFPIITIISVMAITLIAEKSGLFELLANRIAKRANGNGKRLFTYLYFTGTVTGTVFTNDAAVLIFTPLVFNLIEEVKGDDWTRENKVPYYFAVLYVANLVGALVISNPINIVVSSIFHIPFLEYARWMILPAMGSIAVSYLGLRHYFRREIPETFVPITKEKHHNSKFMWICAAVLMITLIGFFTEGITHIPVWLAALSGAILLLVLYSFIMKGNSVEIIQGIGWDVIIFVVGIFIVALGLRNAGLTHHIGHFITNLAGEEVAKLSFVTGFTASFFSSIMNNHPTADMMSWVIRDFSFPHLTTRMLAFSALVGGDLGPKMLPLGSLAALIWFRLLRDRGVNIPYSLYVRIGVPVTLSAIFFSLLILNLEHIFIQHFFPGQ